MFSFRINLICFGVSFFFLFFNHFIKFIIKILLKFICCHIFIISCNIKFIHLFDNRRFSFHFSSCCHFFSDRVTWSHCVIFKEIFSLIFEEWCELFKNLNKSLLSGINIALIMVFFCIIIFFIFRKFMINKICNSTCKCLNIKFILFIIRIGVCNKSHIIK